MTESIRMLKQKDLMDLIKIEDLYVVHKMCEDRKRTAGEQLDAQWMEEDGGNERQVMVAELYPQAAEQRLSNSSFIYSITIDEKKSILLKYMHYRFQIQHRRNLGDFAWTHAPKDHP